jgi:hypothetical protein
MRGAPIYLDGNDDTPDLTVTTPDPTTGLPVPATGLTGLQFRLSATRDGPAIHPALQVNASERTGLGEYYGSFTGTDLMVRLASYAGRDVYQTFGDGVHATYTVARRVTAVRP